MASASNKSNSWSVDTSKDRYRAGMLLGGVGDALGYKNVDWEFSYDGEKIHKELKRLGGVDEIDIEKWRVSDDTIMHLATANALIGNKRCYDLKNVYYLLADHCKKCMGGMNGRSAEETCIEMCKKLNPTKTNGYRIPFNPRGGGCGAAMRSMYIGLRYPRPRDIEDLIEVSIEAGRMTHHHPTGYFGSLASALLALYAVQKKPLREWGAGRMETLIRAKKYIISCKDVYVKDNTKAWCYFERKWSSYLSQRGISSGRKDPQFPPELNTVGKRDQFYSMISYENRGGASGHDAPMIAYDALLACNGNWEELCKRAMFHGGDSDSTGSIAGCLFGILYGFAGVPKRNYERLEYRERLEKAGIDIYKLVFGDAASESR